VPVAQRPFIEWVLELLARAGISQFVISLHHLAHVAEAYFAARPPDRLLLRTVCEPAPLGTGGAICWAAQTLPKTAPLVVANGDSLVIGDLTAAWTTLARPDCDGVIVATPAADATRFGTLKLNGQGRLTGFEEKRAGSGLINTGIYFFKPRLLEFFPTQRPLSMEQECFPALLAAGTRWEVLIAEGPLLDIGTPDSLRTADGFIQQHFFPEHCRDHK
jgi:D-glycero-alpha-D-manno-heptose 1-phosphate guanylyltransferase